MHANGNNTHYRNETLISNVLRSISVPIISNERCRKYYGFYINITDQYICTLDTSGKKSCGNGDSGGPLVVHGQLVGVYVGSTKRDKQYFPDVFMKLSSPEYKNWIISNTPHNPYNPRNSLQEIVENRHDRLWFGVPRRNTFRP